MTRQRQSGATGPAWQATAGLALVEARTGDPAAAERLFHSLSEAPGYGLAVNAGRRAEAEALHARILAESGRAPASAAP